MKRMTALLIIAMMSAGLMAQDMMETGFSKGTTRIGANVMASETGLSYGGNLEYGLTNQWGAQVNANINNYESGVIKWDFTTLDIWGVYHTAGNFGDGGYYTGGVTVALFSADNTQNPNEQTGTGVLFGFGTGEIFNLGDKLRAYVETRFKVGTLESDNYKLEFAWFLVGGGIYFDL